MEGDTGMKAIVVKTTGGPEVLQYTEVEDPSVDADQLLVDVEAAGVNYIDTYHRGGLYPLDLPFTPGLEGAGTVRAVGNSVSEFAPGDRVGWTGVLGTYAEQVGVPEASAIPIPQDLELETVAALLLQGITAHYLATDTFPLGPSDRCLIHAGAGGVGLLLTQIAKLRGAEVTTTVGSPEKAELSRAAGADNVILYRETDFKSEVEDIYGPSQIDVVYDGVGAATFDKGIEVLRPRGMMVTFGNASGPVPELSPLRLSQAGSIFLTRPTMFHYIATRAELLSRTNELFGWVQAGDLNVRIGAEFELSQAAEAHRALEGRATTGKVMLKP